METIAILDDERDIVKLVCINLTNAGFTAKGFSHSEEFLAYVSREIPALIILDLMLPGTDGVELFKKFRADKRTADIPVIMLTAKSEEIDRVLGLELGADDYVTKPFSPRELVARVKTVLRRAHGDRKTVAEFGILSVDFASCSASVHDKRVDLTKTEYRILECLCKKPGWVFSRDAILEFVWGGDKSVVDRTVDVHVRYLREKLGDAASFVQSVRGMGYMFKE